MPIVKIKDFNVLRNKGELYEIFPKFEIGLTFLRQGRIISINRTFANKTVITFVVFIYRFILINKRKFTVISCQLYRFYNPKFL